MRAAVWCATALALIAAVACGALRPNQAEGGTRLGRRLSSRAENNSFTGSIRPEQTEIDHTSIRPKSSRRRESYSERDVVRSRSRSRPQEIASSTPGIDTQVKSQTERNERFSSRRTYSRTRNRTNEETKTVQTTPLNSYTVRNRVRQGSRKTPALTPTSIAPKIDESKIEVINSNLEDITKIYDTPSSTAQFRRRSSTAFVSETESPKRSRSRINTRVELPSSAPDLDSSGTTNDITLIYKEPTTARNSRVFDDTRSSRKLRYKTRLSETDTNLTGEGLKPVSNEDKSSQNKENIPSQEELQTSTLIVSETTENINPATTSKRMKVVRRPLNRGAANFRPTVSLKKKSDEEISEDDNYPESFKALLQAKNASTHSNSPTSESLSVKASQIVYNTYSPTSQSVNTETEKSQKNERYRNKPLFEDKTSTAESATQKNKENIKTDEEIKSTEKNVSRRPEYKPRPIFTPRNRKNSLSTTTSNNAQSSTEKPSYKYNRKFKLTTESSGTEKEKRLPTSNSFKKPLVRPPYYSRQRNSVRSNGTSTEENSTIGTTKKAKQNDASTTNPSNYRTSYYSRLRGSRNNTTENPKEEKLFVEKKEEKSFEKPALYTTVTSLGNDNTVDIQPENKNKEVFVIAVTSKESQEQSTENEMNIMNSEKNDIDVSRHMSTTSKYHASYKNMNAVSADSVEEIMMTSSPPIRNILPRKFGRGRKVENELNEDTSTPSTSNESNVRKFSESYLKFTTPSTNGITQDTEKSKSRFSSKYRAPYSDKPIYKATVPTITPSTAWLKFFVTDRDLIKTIQDPDWFVDDPFLEATTDSMPRQPYIQTSQIIHESPIELVEGEENQLGPDMNSITFTQTRHTLSSADLRLSESVVKSSHVMNVEASNHSPSVTVSIFDALADILTSTPRPRLSSTTEVLPKTDNIIAVKQTLDGVSKNMNSVNSVRNLASQDTFMSINQDITTDSKPVQITGQTTQTNVINRMSVGENVSPSLNEELNKPTSTLPSTTHFPDPTPTTPVSARRPFAIKVLYTATEIPSDMTSTTTYQPSTDHPTMVHNKESDILVHNNNFVSSELTSMLSNNIKDLLKNMDENTRSKVSVNMATLLRNLIPRAINGVSIANNNVDVIPETTPYSLEAIKDTEIEINFNNSENLSNDTSLSEPFPIQNVSNENLVNITVDTPEISSSSDIDINTELPEIIFAENMGDIINTVSEFNSQKNVEEVTSANVNTAESNTVTSTNITPEDTTLPDSLNNDAEIVNTSVTLGSDTTNINPIVPIPFFTNSKISDFTLEVQGNLGEVESTTVTTKSIPLSISATTSNPNPLAPQIDLDNIDSSDPSKVSPQQLWILSKKASVLKMIEDLIKQHYNELSNQPSLSQIEINKPVSPSISERLTEIMNNMNTTTTINVSNFSDMISNIMTTTPLTTFDPISPLSPIPITSQSESPTTPTPDDGPTSPLSTPDISVTLDSRSILESTTKESINKEAESTTSTSPIDNTDSITTEKLVDETKTSETTTIVMETTSLNEETIVNSTETTTPNTFDTTTQNNVDASIETTTSESQNVAGSTIDTSVINTVTQSTPPKKDYVIFGILPNNTVVRKDPNDDVLETLTEASPYIVYGVLPNNTIIRKFPNGTRVPRVMQKIDILPISPWSLRNPYSPIHNNPAIVKPQYNPIRASTNVMTSTDTSNNEAENQLTTDTVNNQQNMISSSALDLKDNKDSRLLGFVTTTNKSPAEKSTASHVLSLRTTTMLPSVDEILLNSISSATKEESVISSMMSSTNEPRILTLDIDPETKQIRTEKPANENMNAVFKFIPIEDVTVQSQNSNVQKLATKIPTTTVNTEKTETTVTESNAQISQIQMSTNTDSDPTTTVQVMVGTPLEENTEEPSPVYVRPTEQNNLPTLTTTENVNDVVTTLDPTTTSIPMTVITTTEAQKISTTTTEVQEPTEVMTEAVTSTSTTETAKINVQTKTDPPTTTALPTTTINLNEDSINSQEDALLLRNLLTGRSAQSYNALTNNNKITTQKSMTTLTTTADPKINAVSDKDTEKLLQALLSSGPNSKIPSIGNRQQTPAVSTTSRSIEEDIKQFEEDTKLLKALLQATGQNPANFNIPTLNIKTTTPRATQVPTTTTTNKPTTTTPSIEEDIRKFQEDAKLLQVLLQSTGQNPKTLNLPIISGTTSNVRMSSKAVNTVQSTPMTTASRPVYVPIVTTQSPTSTTLDVSTLTTTFQPRETTENFKISTTYAPFTNQRRRIPTTTVIPESTTVRSFQRTTQTNGRQATGRFTVTTELPSTSTFSVEEDVAFLNNLKSVLNTNNIEDHETALANRIIALAVEKSLNEITTSKSTESYRGGKAVASGFNNRIPIGTVRPTTTSTSTTTTTTTTTTTEATTLSTPSIEEDIKQFQEDTKLLQALLKATGQDPSKFKIPSIPEAPTNVRLTPTYSPKPQDDLKLLSSLLASPSPLSEPSKPTKKPIFIQSARSTSARPFGAKIAVKDNYKHIQDEAMLLNTLIKLQGVGETTTQLPKLTITGQTPDQALKLLQRTKQTGPMISEATQSPMSLSTEYGKSQDALLAALLKEQGFGPTTASSLDEQLRLAALLNQVVVTPKARRTTTTPPPPPPAPRRPIIDGLAWLWQQWRETAPGPGGSRPNRRPAPAPSMATSAQTSSRVNWFGSGPFVGNADDRPASTANRVPLEPPAVVAEQAPGGGRGQLVSAAINVTRAFSQFLGAALQGAAQTVQSVIRAGQRAASDAYVNGSG